jgi:large subunit ribosomal protein L31
VLATTYVELTVKPNLHPIYRTVVAECACGNKFETRTTAATIHVEVCSDCHPYFTGRQRLMDTAGRVDRFRRKYGSEQSTPTPAQ